MRSPWANPTDLHMIGEMDHMEQSDHDFSLIDRERDLPPDEHKPSLWDERDDEPYDHEEEDDDA